MYIGSTDTRGLMHCLWEIIDNAVDEALGGFGREILVTLRSDGGVTVHDQGRGIPVDIEPRTGLSGVEVVFTKLHAGGKFGAGSYNATGGLHGVGASVVNALSSRLDVEVDRNGGDVRDVVPARGAGHLRRTQGPNARFSPGATAPAKVGPGAQGRDRHPDPLLARPADLPPRRPALADATCRTGRGRPASWCPGWLISVVDASRHPGGGHRGDLPARRRHLGVLRVPRRRQGGHRRHPPARPGPVHRDRADAGRQRAHGADRRRSRPATSTSRCAGATATTPGCSPTSTSSPRPKGGTHVAGFERALTKTFGAACRTPGCSRRARRWSRTTCSRA